MSSWCGDIISTPARRRKGTTPRRQHSQVWKWQHHILLSTLFWSHVIWPQCTEGPCSTVQSSLEQRWKGGTEKWRGRQREGGRENKKRHTPSMSHLSDAGDRIQGFAHSKRAPYHWATIPVLMFSIEILPRVLRFVIMEFGIALLCLKALRVWQQAGMRVRKRKMTLSSGAQVLLLVLCLRVLVSAWFLPQPFLLYSWNCSVMSPQRHPSITCPHTSEPQLCSARSMRSEVLMAPTSQFAVSTDPR